MSWTPKEVADVCRKWGTHLWVPQGIDGAKMLWALSGCESSFGINCRPRHEAAYCTGRYSHDPRVQRLTAEYGCQAHCSYGPWQLLIINVPDPIAPQDFVSLDRCAMETVSFINRRILKQQSATTLEAIADAYNSGDWRDQLRPEKYIHDFCSYYNTVPMPPA